MLEKDIENLIAEHPDEIFPTEGFRLIGQQYVIEGKRIDILFEDKLERKIIVEVKRGILSREASGQISEYYGLLKSKNQDEFYEMVLCANVIPKERRLFLANIGINYKNVESSNIATTTIMPRIQFITLALRESFPSLNNQPTAQISNTPPNINIRCPIYRIYTQ